MSEILKKAFARPHAINQSKNYHMVNKGKWPKYIWDFYPLAQDYYHEFNPYFVHLLYNPRIMPEFKIFTVRDGAYAFADFMVKNLKEIPKWKNHFLIPEKYAPLIPEQMKGQFLSYSSSQVRKPDIRKAKTVTIFAILCDQYFGDYEKVKEKLAVLKDMAPDAKIEVCISQRRNPLLPEEKENFHYIQTPELIRSAAGSREVKWLKLRDFMEKTVLRDNFLVDLMDGKLLTCDSYLHYWFLNRGGMVNALPEWNKKPSLFDIDISFGQKLHVSPLPEVSCQIAELIFVSKTTKDELITNPIFQDEVRKIIST
jgi:hypothetical protein